MREFMTKVSDYWNERRNNPDRQEDRLAVVIIGAIAVVVIVLLLLILWGHIAGERAQKDQEQKKQESGLVSNTYEEHAAEYMAENSGQEISEQEYLTDMAYLSERVAELLATLSQVEQNLSETMEQYQEEDAALQEKIFELHTEVTTIVRELKETQTKLQDLYDIVQVMDEETIPIIQAQITEIREDMKNMHADIADLYAKIAALQQEDVKLWESIGNLEQVLETTLNQNMTEVNNQIDRLLNRISAVENSIAGLAGRILRFRYDEGENTLYLEPYTE